MSMARTSTSRNTASLSARFHASSNRSAILLMSSVLTNRADGLKGGRRSRQSDSSALLDKIRSLAVAHSLFCDQPEDSVNTQLPRADVGMQAVLPVGFLRHRAEKPALGIPKDFCVHLPRPNGHVHAAVVLRLQYGNGQLACMRLGVLVAYHLRDADIARKNPRHQVRVPRHVDDDLELIPGTACEVQLSDIVRDSEPPLHVLYFVDILAGQVDGDLVVVGANYHNLARTHV